MDDIKCEPPPAAAETPAPDKPKDPGTLKSVGPESEVRGGPEAPAD